MLVLVALPLARVGLLCNCREFDLDLLQHVTNAAPPGPNARLCGVHGALPFGPRPAAPSTGDLLDGSSLDSRTERNEMK